MNLPELWSLFSSVACIKLNQNKKNKKTQGLSGANAMTGFLNNDKKIDEAKTDSPVQRKFLVAISADVQDPDELLMN